jgi:membrane protein required for colicin V production
MGGTDTVIVAVVLFCGALGLYWGLIRQVLAIAGLFAGIAVASAYERDVATLLSSVVSVETIARTVAFILILVAVSGLASLIASILRKFVGLIFLGWADHLAGGVIGLVQGVLVCATVIILSAALPNELWSPAIAESQFAQPLVQFAGGVLFRILPDSFELASHMVLGIP